MSVVINGQTIRWDSPNKTVSLSEGTTNVQIIGASKSTRTCPMTRHSDALTWPAIADCQGVVLSGNVIYFPAF